MVEMIEVPGSLRDQMLQHALQGFPLEACGLLAGRFVEVAADANGGVPAARAERFYPMTNADASPVTYRLDPTEQLRVFNEVEDQGMEVVGIFHSHTHSEAYPSETDRRQAFYPDAHYLLVSLEDRNNPTLRAFSIRDGSIVEQEPRIV